MKKIILALCALSLLTAVKPLSFDETQRRYLNPSEIINLYKTSFPAWNQSYCQFSPFGGGEDLMELLGQNRPALGAPVDSAPSSGLVARLRACIERSLSWEVDTFDNGRRDPEERMSRFWEKIRDLRGFIPCLGGDCSQPWKANWHYVRLNQLSVTDQEYFITETLRTLWGEPLIYEDLNPGARYSDLLGKIRAQLAEKSLQETYTQIQLWAALRDEFLLF